MRVALASDHAGYELKEHLKKKVQALGHTVIDKGTHGQAAVDYPDFAEAAALAVTAGEAERALLLCGSGVGACVAVNKIPGARGGLCHDSYSARQGVEHDDINVLVLGARVIGSALAEDLVERFLNARFTREERHERRLAKVKAIEKRYAGTLPRGERS